MIHDNSPVLAPQRREQIRCLVRDEGVVRVQDLLQSLGVSVATIRRDLEILEEEGKVQRVHGGAITMEGRLEEALFDDKKIRANKEKSLIAEEAYKLIGKGDSLYLDGGSTTLGLARMLKDRTDLTLVTNSLRAAAELADDGPKVILIGGELRRISQTIVGPLSTGVLSQLRVDKAFMGTMGFCLTHGLTTTDPNEAFVKNLVAKHAGQVILLADSGKVEKVSFARVSDWDDVDDLVSDRNLPKPFAETLRKRGVKVRIASSNNKN